MKYLVLLGDGMADFPLEELGGRTPLEAAATPAMDAVAQRGISGLFCPIPDGMPPGSDIGNLSMFGYNPREWYTGRAPLEAANQGIELADGEVVFRCNLVTLDDGVMASFTADHISTAEGAELIEALNAGMSGLPVRFHAGVGYRHLAVIATNGASTEGLVRLACEPPHNISDQPVKNYLPAGDGREVVEAIMKRSQEILRDHPVNLKRAENGHAPATSVWLWGQGSSPRLPSYAERHGLTGAVISAVDLVKGIGRCAGLEVIDVPGATGYIDTNYAGKVAAALDALERVDFIYLHVEAPDETAHEGRTDLKIQAIEDFDKAVVAPCLAYAGNRDDARLLVAPDHVTAISTRTHAGGPVPFALCGQGITPNGATAYHEREAERFGVLFPDGYMLTPHMLSAPAIELPAKGAYPCCE